MLPLIFSLGIGAAFILSSCSGNEPVASGDPQSQPVPEEPPPPPSHPPDPRPYDVDLLAEEGPLGEIYRELSGRGVPDRAFDRGALRYFAGCRRLEEPVVTGRGDHSIESDEIILVLYDLADLAPEDEGLQEMIARLQENRELRPEIARALWRSHGELEVRERRMDAATVSLLEYIDNPPRDAVMNPKIYLFDLGEIAWVRGNLEDAEMYFQRSIRNLPRAYDGYCLLAGLLESLGRSSDARWILRHAPEPRSPAAVP